MYIRTSDALRTVMVAFLVSLVALAAAATYWQVLRAPELAKQPSNPRTRLSLAQVERGGIHARHGELLAWTERRDGQVYRHYKVTPGLSQVVGYADERLGVSGLELAFNSELSGQAATGIYRMWQLLRGTSISGADVYTTIDLNVQKTAERALAGRRGAAVVLELPSGRVLASASFPGFDPNQVSRRWSSLSHDPASPLLNRVTQGLYPPGSSFKVLIALEAIEDRIVTTHTRYYCTGERRVGKDIIRDVQGQAHGPIDLTRAMAVSCNYVFSGLGLQLGPARFTRAVDKARLTVRPTFDTDIQANSIPRGKELGSTALAELGIGQGSLAVTPLAMARLAAIVALEGVDVQPYLVESVRDPLGHEILRARPHLRARAFTAATARSVDAMLRAVVTSGTGAAAALPGIYVAGKTGTAENPHGRAHAWFIGYAPADAPKVAVAVVLENGGGGGAIAAPVAGEILGEALRVSYQ